MLLVNIIMSIVQLKHVLHSFMQVIGFTSAPARAADLAGPVEFPDEYSFCSGLIVSELANEIRKALPLSAYNPDLHASAQANGDCPVCLQEFHKDEEVCHLPFCRHLYHKFCLAPWLDQQQFTCPVCRSSLVSEEVCRRQRKREQEISDELTVWLSSTHGSNLQGLWC
ncbi:hypothetical protein KP509_10G020700 [Ceratopteris richardii]|nr:hypothetical protein KP509_10G020700 [Ceratopteris richardii]